MSQVDQDPAGVDVSFGFEISAGISSLREEVRRLRRDVQRTRNEVPRDRREFLYGQPNNQFPAAGNLILACDGPQLGKLWDVRQILVAAPTMTTSPAGVAYVFSQPTAPLDLSSASCRDFTATAFPAKAGYGTGQFKMRPLMNLWVVIVGGTVGQTYVCYADVLEYSDTPMMQTTADV
jgi:hypothetical protein